MVEVWFNSLEEVLLMLYAQRGSEGKQPIFLVFT